MDVMNDTDTDTSNHELWLYYTSGTACESIIFDLYYGRIKYSMGKQGCARHPGGVVIVYLVSYNGRWIAPPLSMLSRVSTGG